MKRFGFGKQFRYTILRGKDKDFIIKFQVIFIGVRNTYLFYVSPVFVRP
jgi:hypothetical protein